MNDIKELVERTILDNDFTDEQKATLINKLFDVSQGVNWHLEEGFYLNAIKDENTPSVYVRLCYLNVAENGMKFRGDTGYNTDQIFALMKNACVKNDDRTR